MPYGWYLVELQIGKNIQWRIYNRARVLKLNGTFRRELVPYGCFAFNINDLFSLAEQPTAVH